MADYRIKPGPVGKAVLGTYKKVEQALASAFLKADADNPTGYSLKCGKVEDAVLGAYKAVETGVVGAYQKIEAKFVDTFLEEVDDEPDKVASASEIKPK